MNQTILKRNTNRQQHEKKSNVLSHQGNANLNYYTESPSHPCQIGNYQRNKEYKSW
jgi:hypothetical protein